MPWLLSLASPLRTSPDTAVHHLGPGLTSSWLVDPSAPMASRWLCSTSSRSPSTSIKPLTTSLPSRIASPTLTVFTSALLGFLRWTSRMWQSGQGLRPSASSSWHPQWPRSPPSSLTLRSGASRASSLEKLLFVPPAGPSWHHGNLIARASEHGQTSCSSCSPSRILSSSTPTWSSPSAAPSRWRLPSRSITATSALASACSASHFRPSNPPSSRSSAAAAKAAQVGDFIVFGDPT